LTTEYDIDYETASNDIFTFIENMSKYLIVR
jgi:hypothetical protein